MGTGAAGEMCTAELVNQGLLSLGIAMKHWFLDRNHFLHVLLRRLRPSADTLDLSPLFVTYRAGMYLGRGFALACAYRLLVEY